MTTDSLPGEAIRASRSSTFASIDRAVRSPRLLTALVLVGVALRAWSYIGGDTLWLDEILLSRNVLELPMWDLLTDPLYLDQVAPQGFLFLEKLAVMLFGPNEHALRLFPFAFSIAGLFLFRRLAEQTLDGWAVPFAVALCALGIPFIRYAAEVKQYGADMMVATLLPLLALDVRRAGASTRRRLLAGAAGFLVMWLSQSSVIIMGGIGLAFAIEWLLTRDREVGSALVVTIALWALASLAAVYIGIHSMTPETREFMDDFWSGGFLPLPFDTLGAVKWYWAQSLSLFTDPTLMRVRWPVLFLVLSVVGIAALWRRHRDVALLLTGPLVVALIAAVAQQFPYRGRQMLYLLPGILLAVAAGAEAVRRSATRLHVALGALSMLILVSPAAVGVAEMPPPYDIERHRDMLSWLQQRRQPGDLVWVFPLTRIGTLFYGPQYGLQPDEWITSVCDRNDVRPFIRDVDRFRGVSRLWVITTQAFPYRVARPAVRRYLGTIGVRRDSLILPSLTQGEVSVDLYDLSDPVRLAVADAASFPVLPMPTNPRPGCRPWTRGDAPASLMRSPSK